MNWHLSHRASKRGVKLADRHYSRQKPGTPQFVKPSRCLVLLDADAKALWVTSWPFPQYVKHEWAGAWECSLFRNESPELASVLIREAVAATRSYFGRPPAEGFISFIDPRKVRPTMVRGLPAFGYCWIKAGWHYAGTTKAGLLCFRQLAADMPRPEIAHGITVDMFAEQGDAGDQS